MRSIPLKPAFPPTRRGVTLLELMVVVGLLVLIMSILVQIFKHATEALHDQRTFAGINQEIKRFDSVLRRDLAGVTARMTPPNNPAENRGYFTYGENAPADEQGEDTDDYLAFTAKAPEGQPFSGYIMLPQTFNTMTGLPVTFNRVRVTSDLAEVVYFLRNGNLYRRVLLVLPQSYQRTLTLGTNSAGTAFNPGGGYSATSVTPATGLYGFDISWAGLNDVSARPARVKGIGDSWVPTLNTLGDLTNRENRAFNPRFSDDYFTYDTVGGTYVNGPDGTADDMNADGLPDFVPILYPGAFAAGLIAAANFNPQRGFITGNPALFAFPYVYPNGFDVSDPITATTAPVTGAIHNLNRYDLNGSPIQGNHAPLDVGDPFGPPGSNILPQTWWGFPTKKEQMSIHWTDPVKRINDPRWGAAFPATSSDSVARAQSLGLRPAYGHGCWGGMGPLLAASLPPISSDWRNYPRDPAIDFVNTSQGSASNFIRATNNSGPVNPEAWRAIPEEDLLMTGVRSFDVKALEDITGLNDNGTPADPRDDIYRNRQLYVDLGYGGLLNGTPSPILMNLDNNPNTGASGLESAVNTLLTFGHEGRIPPLPTDLRTDPVWGGPIGDSAAGVVRLRRVWDSWSTDYSNVPWRGLDPSSGPLNGGLRPYPSYPAPYPAPLRGIQVQLRVVDPTNQKIKLHTIHQSFADKL